MERILVYSCSPVKGRSISTTRLFEERGILEPTDDTMSQCSGEYIVMIDGDEMVLYHGMQGRVDVPQKVVHGIQYDNV